MQLEPHEQSVSPEHHSRESDTQQPNKPQASVATDNPHLSTGRMSNRLEELYKIASSVRVEESKSGEKLMTQTISKLTQAIKIEDSGRRGNIDDTIRCQQMEDITTTDKRAYANKVNSSKRTSMM